MTGKLAFGARVFFHDGVVGRRGVHLGFGTDVPDFGEKEGGVGPGDVGAFEEGDEADG